MSTVALENKTILVTGAAGFIGSNLVKRICEGVPSAKVVGIDSVNDYYDVALKEFRLNELSKYESFTFIKGNIANELPEGVELPAGRTKPWGTGHAVLACKEVLHEPFAVINADDYYGKEAFVKLHGFLVGYTPEKANQFCMAGFILKNLK